MPDVNTRLELYRELAKPEAAEKLDDIAQEYHDRFGAVPREVENLLYAVRIKNLAAKAGIESVSTEEGQIIIRRFQGLPFEKQKLEPILREGVTVGRTRIVVSYKKLRGWRKVLEEIVKLLT